MPTQKHGIVFMTSLRVCFHEFTKVWAIFFGACPISPSKWIATSSATAQPPFSIRNMLSASKCPLAFSVHSASKQIVLYVPIQGERNIISGMISERHNVAWRIIMRAISKGSIAGCLVHLGALPVWPSGPSKILSMLITGRYQAGFLMPFYPPETG